MKNIYLQVNDEKLSFQGEKPYITSGNKNFNNVVISFSDDWQIENNRKFLYVLRDNEVIDKEEITNNTCGLNERVFDVASDIEFFIEMIASQNELDIRRTTSRLKMSIYQGATSTDFVKEYPEIKLYRGCESAVLFDFSEFDFQGGSVELTIKRNARANTLFTHTFTENEEYELTFDQNFTSGLSYSNYQYDLVFVINNKRYPLCVPSKISVKEMINNG